MKSVVGSLLIFLLLCFGLSGCTIVQSGEIGSGESKSSRLLIGLVKVEIPATTGRLSAVSTKTLGLGWEKGPFLGWRDSSWVMARPQDCQMLVIIRSSVEAEQAARVLEQIKGEKICVADFSNTLQPASR